MRSGGVAAGSRPRSASGIGGQRRPPSAERSQPQAGIGSAARGKSRDRDTKEEGVAISARSSSRPRPAQALPPRPAQSAAAPGQNSGGSRAQRGNVESSGGGGCAGRSLATAVAAAEAEQPLASLQARCRELKSSTNTIEQENVKMRTRLMALERDLKKRETLLLKLTLLAKAGQGLGVDLIEKLREERNLLPIYRKKAAELQKQIDAKDAEIKELKRDPKFTRILELQVEYASWQHETKRIESLVVEPSPDVNPAARREIEVHEKRADDLEDELMAAKSKLETLMVELGDAEADHTDWTGNYRTKEQELKVHQDLTRNKAVAFKDLLQKRKEVEQLESECEMIELEVNRYEDEINSLKATALVPPTPAPQPLGRRAVSVDVMNQSPHFPQTPGASSSFQSVRTAAASRLCQASLLSQLVVADSDADGLVSIDEFATALAAVGCMLPRADIEAMVAALPDSGHDGLVRWLDLLAVLDRSASSASIARGPSDSANVVLPEIRPLRSACLKAGITAEELKRRIQATGWQPTRQQVDALLVGELHLEGDVATAWAQAWHEYGTRGVLLRVPFGEVAPSEESYHSWLARCADAVRELKGELDGTSMEGDSSTGAFTVWSPEMVITEEQFKISVPDVLGAVLSDEDIDDVALYASCGEGMVDGKLVMQLAAS